MKQYSHEVLVLAKKKKSEKKGRVKAGGSRSSWMVQHKRERSKRDIRTERVELGMGVWLGNWND